jgi:acyl carrier protein
MAAENRASVDAVLGPKVEGSRVVAELVAGKGLDFLLFCSSISSVVPAVGASSYAAANSFQDRYATWCQQHLGIPAVAINFDAWQEIGMAAEVVSVAGFEHVKENRLKTAMTTAEGLETIERILRSGEPQVLVTTVDVLTMMRTAVQEPKAGSVAVETGGSALNPETAAVIAIWEELLGAESITATDNFFELGGHSLLGTMVLARIRERFGVELTIRAIFEAPTPESLGNRIREAEPAEPEAQAVGAAGDREDFEF